MTEKPIFNTSAAMKSKLEIPLRSFVKDQYEASLSHKDEEFFKIFKELLNDKTIDENSVSADIQLLKYNQTVTLNGSLSFSYSTPCDRCGEEIKVSTQIPLVGTFSPRDDSNAQSFEEETELSEDDLDYSEFDGDNLLLSSFFNDEIALSIPINHYCEDHTACQNRFEKLKFQHSDDDVDPRLAELKNFSFKKS